MEIRFTKMHGAGNDYIYVNAFEQTLKDPPAFATRFSDRHKGIGGDGLVLIGPSAIADVRMRMFNADGSEGSMCSNASRCIAKHVYERGICQKETIRLETLAGIKELHVHAEGGRVQAVTVNMGTPKLHPADLPMLAGGETFVGQPVEVAGRTYQAPRPPGRPTWSSSPPRRSTSCRWARLARGLSGTLCSPTASTPTLSTSSAPATSRCECLSAAAARRWPAAPARRPWWWRRC